MVEDGGRETYIQSLHATTPGTSPFITIAYCPASGRRPSNYAASIYRVREVFGAVPVQRL